MAQHTPEPSAEPRRSDTASGVAVITAALMVGMARFATSKSAATPSAPGHAGREPADLPADGD